MADIWIWLASYSIITIRGIVIDSTGKQSEQIDLIIYDAQHSYVGKEFYNPNHTISFTEDEQEVVSTYATDIDSYGKQAVSRWITGEGELIDTTWDAYITEPEKMCVDELTKVNVSAHNRFFGVE